LVCKAGSFSATRNLLRHQINRSVYVDAAVDLPEQGIQQMHKIDRQLATVMRTVV